MSTSVPIGPETGTAVFQFPASFAQEQLWFLDQLDPGSPLYNLPQALELTGPLAVERLLEALNALVARHESLRTTFAADDGRLIQMVAEQAAALDLPIIDLQHCTAEEQRLEVQRLVVLEARAPFDLVRGPLVRARLLRLSPEAHVLLLTVHHIVADGWSLEILRRELAALYESGPDRAASLGALPLQYADYAHWQRERLTPEEIQQHATFWRERLAGVAPVLPLPTDRPRPAIQTFEGAIARSVLAPALVKQLKALSAEEGVTLSMSLQAAFLILLARYSREDDIVIGVVSAGRPRDEIEQVVGFFATTLPLRVDLSGDPSVRELLSRVRNAALDAYAHEDLPFEKLVEALQPVRSLSHNPIMQVMFVGAPPGDEQIQMGPVAMRSLPIDGGTAKYDLTLLVDEGRDSTSLALEYNTALYDRETAERMLRHLELLIRGMVETPSRAVSRLSMLTPEERQQRISSGGQPLASSHPQQSIVDLFERQVARTPDAVALVHGNERLTYGQLNARVNRIARDLQRRGVGAEVLVGLAVERSLELVVGILAILKAGGAYVPLDPGLPPARLRFMIDDAQARVVLTQAALAAQLRDRGRELVLLDEFSTTADRGDESNLGCKVAAESAAYVIYTSGSTGTAKGVQVTHHNVVRLFESTNHWFHFDERDVWTLFHSYGFDFSVWELFGALLYGGRLVVVPYLISRSPEAFYELLEEEQVTVLNQTPSAFEQLLRVEDRRQTPGRLALRLVIFGGEALNFQSLGSWFARHGDTLPQLVNMYGITETTVHVTYRPLRREDAERSESLIGTPIPDLQVYVLDRHLEPLPVGVPGELYVGGAGVARGYLRRPELTAERFIRDPFSAQPDARLYRSGDLARYRPDGDVEYLGRADQQVKIRGFRVELGEIEDVLTRHAAVQAAVVLLREDDPGDKRLIAYLVCGSTPPASELREFARSLLPDHMVPSAFVVLQAFPLTGNGKIDRRALPAPTRQDMPADSSPEAARTATETALVELWAAVLGLGGERVGINDNFFDLGGHSLRAVQLLGRVADQLGVRLPIRTLFANPTVAGLARAVDATRHDRAQREERGKVRPVARNRSLPLSLAQEQLWFVDQLEAGIAAYSVPTVLRLTGPLNVVALRHSLQDIVARHESLRTTFAVEHGGPTQHIGETALPFDHIDLGGVADGDREDTARAVISEEVRRPFDLAKGPLFRTTLLQLGQDEHILVLNVHHIVWDGWSQGVFNRELAGLYEGYATGRPIQLAPLPIQYADYACWQRHWLSSASSNDQLAYWKRQLSGAPAVCRVPPDRPGRAQGYEGASETFEVSPEVTQALNRLSQQQRVTLFMTLLAAFQALLAWRTGTSDIVVGTDVANRGLVETENVIGCFVNNLPLRTDLAGNPSFVQLMDRVREVAFGAYSHQDVPFGTLVEHLRPARSPEHAPVFQTLFVLDNTAEAPVVLHDLEVTPVRIDTRTSKFDLALFMTETSAGLGGILVYRSGLYDGRSMSLLVGQFLKLLEAIVARPTARLSELELSCDVERSQRMAAQMERGQTIASGLRGARRRAVNLENVVSIKTSFLPGAERFPLVIEPALADVNLSEWAGSNQAFIERSLLAHGALLFRGFALGTVGAFERFVESICPELFDEYGDLPREGASGKIYKSTPYPNDRPILFHNESSHMHQWPRKIWFHCVTAAAEGGETPIVDCRTVYQQLDPAIRQRFADKHLMYVRNYTDGLDVSWESFFQTSDRKAVEDYCRRAGLSYEWQGANGLRTRQLCPAVVRHPKTGEPSFFNQIQLHHASCLEPEVRESLSAMFSQDDLPRNVLYGDGTPIDDGAVKEIVDLYWQLSVAPKWREGDVMMLDNMLMAHARNPFQGARKIVVAMGELVRSAEVETVGLAG